MKTYKVTYGGNSSRFKGFSTEVNANTAREAVIKVVEKRLDIFHQEDGSITDCDNYTVMESDCDYLFYDGGYFEAEEVTE